MIINMSDISYIKWTFDVSLGLESKAEWQRVGSITINN